MAIVDDNTSNDQGNTGARQDAYQSAAAQTQKGGMWSFHQTNLTKSPVAAGVGGEYFTKFRTAINELFKDIVEGVELKIISLNRQNAQEMRFSAIVVAVRMPKVSSNVAAYHTLILEATGEKLTPRMVNMDNQQVRVNMVTGDAFDDVLQKKAYDAVTAEFPSCHIYSADAMVVPGHVQPPVSTAVGTGNMSADFENVARNAALACVSTINGVTGNFGDLNLAQMDPDCRFVIDVTFGNHQVVDIVGNPQRASVLINYTSQKKNANNFTGLRTVNVADSVAQICELSGFLQPIWSPLHQHQNFGFQPAGYNQNLPTQSFVAELVLTSVRTEFATSPAAVLMAISSVLALVDGDTWIQGFLPKSKGVTKGDVDIVNIGALNIPANIHREEDLGGFGREVNIEKFANDIPKVNAYLTALFRQGLVISMDCPEAGPQSWYLNVFAAAASGDNDARRQIFDALMELTDNHFGSFFDLDKMPMFTNIVRVPGGRYRASDGSIQDLANIDLTAICNLYKNDPAVIFEYSNTFVNRPGVSPERNCAIREGIIQDACNQSATIDRYSARVTFSDDFVKAISNAISQMNIPTTVNTPLNADELRSGVPSPDFVSRSLSSGTSTYRSGYQPRSSSRGYSYSGYRGGYGRA